MVWVSSPTTFVTNSFFASPTFLVGLWGNLVLPSTLDLLFNILIPYRSFFSKERGGSSQFFHLVRPAWFTVKAERLLRNNVDATSFAALLGGRLSAR